MTAVSPSRGWRPSPFAGPAPGGAAPFAGTMRARRAWTEALRPPFHAEAFAGTRREPEPSWPPGSEPKDDGDRDRPGRPRRPAEADERIPTRPWRAGRWDPTGKFGAWASKPGSGAEIACDRNGARPRAEGTTRAGHVVAQRAPQAPGRPEPRNPVTGVLQSRCSRAPPVYCATPATTSGRSEGPSVRARCGGTSLQSSHVGGEHRE